MAATTHLVPPHLRPFRCLLGLHMWRWHPNGGGFRYCRLCGAEQQTR